MVASRRPIRRDASCLRHAIVGSPIRTIAQFSHRLDQESIIYHLRGREFGCESKPYIGLWRLGMQIAVDHQRIGGWLHVEHHVQSTALIRQGTGLRYWIALAAQ